MIRSIRHKGLKRLYENDDPRGVIAEHVAKLCDILARLDAATTAADMNLPGFRLHSAGFHSRRFCLCGSFGRQSTIARLVWSTPTPRRYSDRNASVTSTRAARSAGNTDAITAAASKTTTEATSGNAVSICRDGK